MVTITEDGKALAEATFMKKRMFYNMKIKTMKRIASNVVHMLKSTQRLKIFKINKEIDFLYHKLKDAQREIDENTFETGDQQAKSISEDRKKYLSEVDNKKIIIQGRIYDKYEDITDIQTICESIKKKCYDVSEENIHRLITELEDRRKYKI